MPTPELASSRSPLPPGPPSTDQVYQLLIADLPLVVALCQGHQHVQLGGVQGQLMAVHEAGKCLHPDEARVFGVELWGTVQGITEMPGLQFPDRMGTPSGIPHPGLKPGGIMYHSTTAAPDSAREATTCTHPVPCMVWVPHAMPTSSSLRGGANTLPLSYFLTPAACQPGSHKAKHTCSPGTSLLLLLPCALAAGC